MAWDPPLMPILCEPNNTLKNLLLNFPTTEAAALNQKMLCIEAFPRSGNSYAALAITDLITKDGKNSLDMDHAAVLQKLIHHTHQSEVVRQSVLSNIPTITILRNPLDAIFSTYRYYAGEKRVCELCDWWRQFYLQCLELAKYNHFRIIDFEDIKDSTRNLAKCLVSLKIIRSLPIRSVPVETVLNYIRNEDQKHGRHYEYRAAAPIDRNNRFREDFFSEFNKMPEVGESIQAIYQEVLRQKMCL